MGGINIALARDTCRSYLIEKTYESHIVHGMSKCGDKLRSIIDNFSPYININCNTNIFMKEIKMRN